jgi:hypothetical protein
MMMFFAGEGWGEGMSRMVIDDVFWDRLQKLLPKPKRRHGKETRVDLLEGYTKDASQYLCFAFVNFLHVVSE